LSIETWAPFLQRRIAWQQGVAQADATGLQHAFLQQEHAGKVHRQLVFQVAHQHLQNTAQILPFADRARHLVQQAEPSELGLHFQLGAMAHRHLVVQRGIDGNQFVARHRGGPQAFGHGIESTRQVAHFIDGAHIHTEVQLAGTHQFGPAPQALQRMGHTADGQGQRAQHGQRQQQAKAGRHGRGILLRPQHPLAAAARQVLRILDHILGTRHQLAKQARFQQVQDLGPLGGGAQLLPYQQQFREMACQQGQAFLQVAQQLPLLGFPEQVVAQQQALQRFLAQLPLHVGAALLRLRVFQRQVAQRHHPAHDFPGAFIALQLLLDLARGANHQQHGQRHAGQAQPLSPLQASDNLHEA